MKFFQNAGYALVLSAPFILACDRSSAPMKATKIYTQALHTAASTETGVTEITVPAEMFASGIDRDWIVEVSSEFCKKTDAGEDCYGLRLKSVAIPYQISFSKVDEGTGDYIINFNGGEQHRDFMVLLYAQETQRPGFPEFAAVLMQEREGPFTAKPQTDGISPALSR